jgi:hypothetical protein
MLHLHHKGNAGTFVDAVRVKRQCFTSTSRKMPINIDAVTSDNGLLHAMGIYFIFFPFGR